MKVRELLEEGCKKKRVTVKNNIEFANAFDEKYGEGASDEISFYGNTEIGFPEKLEDKVNSVLKSM